MFYCQTQKWFEITVSGWCFQRHFSAGILVHFFHFVDLCVCFVNILTELRIGFWLGQTAKVKMITPFTGEDKQLYLSLFFTEKHVFTSFMYFFKLCWGFSGDFFLIKYKCMCLSYLFTKYHSMIKLRLFFMDSLHSKNPLRSSFELRVQNKFNFNLWPGKQIFGATKAIIFKLHFYVCYWFTKN